MVKKKVGGTPSTKATKAKAAKNARIAAAKAGREHAADDIERGQTPMGAEAAEALLNIGKEGKR